MNFSDEQLSAFLDAELGDAEMDNIRRALEQDETLTNRLAELAMADQLVKTSYSKIDELPLPETVTELLREEHQQRAEIIDFPWWRRLHRGVQQHAAVAACLALVVGFMAAQLMPQGSASNWSNIANVLETGRSGLEQTTANGAEVKPQLTFLSQKGVYCRQFQVQHADSLAEQSIACRGENGWQPVTRIYLERQQNNGYQTASGGSLLDSTLAQLIAGDPFDAAAESEVITRQWQR